MEQHINRTNERALKLLCNDTSNLRFDELLVKDKSVIIHQRNLPLLATENVKVRKGIAPE